MTDRTVLSAVSEWQDVLSAPGPQWVFKHSSTCSIAHAANDEVTQYLAAHPEQPLAMVVVQDARPVSNQIAQDLGRVHQSPQLFLVIDGKSVFDASHWSISAGAMDAAWKQHVS